MFRWRRCSECGLSGWQRAKKILLKFRQATRECSEICDIAGCEIQTGDTGTTPPPPLTGPHQHVVIGFLDHKTKLKISLQEPWFGHTLFRCLSFLSILAAKKRIFFRPPAGLERSLFSKRRYFRRVVTSGT